MLDSFNSWRTHPCTQQLLASLVADYFEQVETALPCSIDESVCIAHQREGARAVLDAVMEWMPDSARQELKAWEAVNEA